MIIPKKSIAKALKRPISRLSELRANTSGVALAEFAYTMPIVLSLGMMGAETANYAVTHMRISQVAMQVADNASRVGEAEVLQLKRVFESDILDVMIGADRLSGGLDVMQNGRVILSSLQENAEGGQEIRWQRCMGIANYTSSFGVEGDGETGTDFPGMGESGREITAAPGTAVMFVEVVFDYDGVTPFNDFITGDTIRYTSAFNIRDDRDLTQLYENTPAVQAATCDRFEDI